MFARIIAIALVMLSMSVRAQPVQTADWWYFGNTAGMQFNGGSPVFDLNGLASTIEGTSTMSDAAGNLLCYSQGTTMWNRNHAVMPNGAGLMGGTSSQQASTIVPLPGNPNLYYNFTTPNTGNATGLRYSVIDMTLAAGLGDIVAATKNTFLYGPVTEKCAAIKHANGIDYWIVSHGYGNNNFVAFLFTAAGVNAVPVTSSLGVVDGGSAVGILKPSPEGTRLATAVHDQALCQLFDFNKSTGVVSNVITLPAVPLAVGISFSPDGCVLYTGAANPSNIFQYDLQAANIPASKITVATPGVAWSGPIRIGKDGKIYVARYTAGDLGVINNPNVLGAGCNYVDVGFNLGGKISQLGFPNHIENIFFNGTCLILPAELVSFTGKSVTEGNLLEWTTASETGTDRFEIERSSDGENFTVVGQLQALGYSHTDHTYSFLDNSPIMGASFYQLRQVDIDGQVKLSDIVKVQHSGIGLVNIYPNPARDLLHIEYAGEGEMKVNIYNTIGQMNRSWVINNGRNPATFNLDGLVNGMYFVEIINGTTAHRQPLVVKR